MKKLLCIVLTITLLMIMGSASFAANTNQNNNGQGQNNNGQGQNVDNSTYKQPPTVIQDENSPGGGVDTTNKGGDSQEVANEDVPKAPLPKTGGIPAEAFYGAGALIILAALILSRKKTAAAKK